MNAIEIRNWFLEQDTATAETVLAFCTDAINSKKTTAGPAAPKQTRKRGPNKKKPEAQEAQGTLGS